MFAAVQGFRSLCIGFGLEEALVYMSRCPSEKKSSVYAGLLIVLIVQPSAEPFSILVLRPQPESDTCSRQYCPDPYAILKALARMECGDSQMLPRLLLTL